MPIKLKKTNIQYDLETPEKGWVIIGVDEDGYLVKKDETGTYEKIVKDETYGIFLRLETDFLTIGNRVQDSVEGLYSLAQGDRVKSTKIYSTSIGKTAYSTGEFSYSHGENVEATGKYSYSSGFSKKVSIISSGINSFVHTASIIYSDTNQYGTNADYSVVLGGYNNKINSSAGNSVILGGHNNIVATGIVNSVILGGYNISATQSNTVYTKNIISDGSITSSILSATTQITTNIVYSNTVNSDYISTPLLHADVISGSTMNMSGVISSGGFSVNDSSYGFIKSNGTVDTNVYLKTGGTSDTMTNVLYLDKLSSTILPKTTNSTIQKSNLIIGYLTLQNVSSGSNLTDNTILGSYNAINLTQTSVQNVIIGSNNINYTPSSVNIQKIDKSIVIGYGNKLSTGVGETNEIIIGYGNTGLGSNTTLIGNSSTTKTQLYGDVVSTGNLISSGYMKLAVFTSDSITPSVANVGAIRYRETTNQSLCEMVMKTGTSTYTWVVIKQNSW